jgi:peptidoglycan/LPS O-acetylase OafA/YrhL
VSDVSVAAAPSPTSALVRARPDGSRPPRLRQMPALDGIRGIALMTVIWHHFRVILGHKRGAPHVLTHTTGEMGLDVFFVLSGCLITSLLLVEADRTGGISLPLFYQRRLRRIAPALILVVLLTALVAAGGVKHVLGPWPLLTLLTVLLWVGNWLAAFHVGALGWLGATWSLAVEEQFYLTWPFVLRRLLRWRIRTWHVVAAFVIGVIICETYTIIALHHVNKLQAYFQSPVVGVGLLFGCVAGIIIIKKPHSSFVALARSSTVAVISAIGLCLIAVFYGRDELALDYGMRLVFDVCTMMLIAHIFVRADRPSVLMRSLSVRPLVGLGLISYGVYLFHIPVISAVGETATALPVVPQMVFDTIVILGAAIVSYYVIEQPIRRYGLKGALRNLTGRSRRPVMGEAHAVVPAHDGSADRPRTATELAD